MTLIDKAEALEAVHEADSLELAQHGTSRIADRIAALPARGVAVKPLEWEDDGNGGFIARGVGRTYNVHRLALDPGVWGAVGVGDTSANADDVKAACDRANTAIVLSALAPTDAAQAREAALLSDAANVIRDLMAAYSKPDERLCCNGHECGCQGATVQMQAEYYANEFLALIGERP